MSDEAISLLLATLSALAVYVTIISWRAARLTFAKRVYVMTYTLFAAAIWVVAIAITRKIAIGLSAFGLFVSIFMLSAIHDVFYWKRIVFIFFPDRTENQLITALDVFKDPKKILEYFGLRHSGSSSHEILQRRLRWVVILQLVIVLFIGWILLLSGLSINIGFVVSALLLIVFLGLGLLLFHDPK